MLNFIFFLPRFPGAHSIVLTDLSIKSCAYHPDTECRTFLKNLKNPKSSDDTLSTFIHVNNTHLVFAEYF